MNHSTEEIAQIIKIGTIGMLLLASIVIGVVMYLHNKMLNTSIKN
jgi:hypothetical protein